MASIPTTGRTRKRFPTWLLQIAGATAATKIRGRPVALIRPRSCPSSVRPTETAREQLRQTAELFSCNGCYDETRHFPSVGFFLIHFSNPADAGGSISVRPRHSAG